MASFRGGFSQGISSLLLYVTLVQSPLFGQADLNYYSLNKGNGLPTNDVYSIVQDSSGLMWLGTDLGLVKYNGTEAKLILPKDKGSLVVLKLFKDTKGRIWLSTFHNGIYYLENDSIKEPPVNAFIMKEQAKNPVIYVRDLAVSNDDILNFTFHSDLSCYYSSHLESPDVEVHFLPNIDKGDIFQIQNEEQGFILSGKRLRRDTFSVDSTLNYNTKIWSTEYNRTYGYSNYGVDHGSNLAWSANVVYLSQNEDDTIALSTLINNIGLIDSSVFISSNNGLYEYKKTGSRLEFQGHYLSGIVISKVLRDNEGVYWASTVGDGSLIIPSINSKRISLPLLRKELDDYSHSLIYDDSLSLLNAEELLRIDLLKDYGAKKEQLIKKEGEVVYSYLLKDGSIVYCKNERNPEKPFPYFTYFYRKKNKKLLYRSPLKIRKKDNRYRQYSGVFAESPEAIFLLTSKGFILAQEDSSIYDSNRDGFSERVNSIASHPRKNLLYVGCSDGVYEFNLQDKTWSLIYEDTKVSDLKFDESLGLLVGTRGNGLLIYSNDKWRAISFGEDYIDNVVKGIYLLDRKIFVQTFNDLVLLDDISGTGPSLKKVSSLFFGETTIQEILFAQQQPILISENGLVSLDTEVFNYPFTNEFSLKSISVNDQELGIKELENAPLNYEENNLNIIVQLKTLHNSSNAKIRYRLEGLKGTWTETRSRSFNFLGLPPGDYSLLVAAENAVGEWSEPRRTLSFTINQPFYKTWWFGLSAALVLAVLAWLTYYSGTKVSQREKQLLLANITALKRQINPHFVLNALSSIRYHQESNNLEKAETYINRLANLFTNIVYSSDNKRVLLSDEIERIENFVTLEETRFDGRLKFELKLEDGLKTERLFIPPMLIQPIVENALEHGLKEVKNPKLTIEIGQQEGVTTICVKDNGPGLEEDFLKNLDRQKSVGISNVLKRVELIRQLEGKHLSINLSNDNGLKVVLNIEQ